MDTFLASLNLDPLILAKALVCAFFAVLFLQSGLDKVIDRKGNSEWLTGHFANSPLKGSVGAMLLTVTLLELTAGVCSIGGVVGAFFMPMAFFTVLGPALSCLVLLMLFFGQRIAKDYPGAATLATYFGVALLGLIVVGVGKLP